MIQRIKQLYELRLIVLICALFVLIGWIAGVATTYGMARAAIYQLGEQTRAAILKAKS